LLENLNAVMEEVEKELDEKDAVREIAIRECREIIRKSSDLIFRMQGREREGLVEGFRELKSKVMGLNTLLDEHPDIYYSGFVEEAMQEYVEASVLRNALEGKNLQTPSQLKVNASTYLMGLSDAIGEFRRLALTSMIEGNVEDAARWVDQMEKLFAFLSSITYPAKLVQIRKKQDTARALLDRTRGELANAYAAYRMSRSA